MAIADLFYMSANGLVIPDYPTVLEELKAEYRTIYGAEQVAEQLKALGLRK